MDHERLMRALISLRGLSVGDALGKAFMGDVLGIAAHAEPPHRPWKWTDDTAMAISIVEALAAGGIEADDLAQRFARRFSLEPERGYGPFAYNILHGVARGEDWEAKARSVHGGAGSLGNGAAMRAAPIGAYYADDLAIACRVAERSSLPTHTHPDGIAGAIAVTVAAAVAAQGGPIDRASFVDNVLARLPPGRTRDGIARAATLGIDAEPAVVARAVGDGSEVRSSDTVPFCIWAAARHLDDYEAALWTTLSVAKDEDTMCAIVGGIVVLHAGVDSIPGRWLANREPLPGHLG